MALLCAVEATRSFFQPTKKIVNGVTHLVVGTSPQQPGVSEDMVEELRDYMYVNFFRGITLDFSEFDGTFNAVVQSAQLNERVQRHDMAEARRKYGDGTSSSISTECGAVNDADDSGATLDTANNTTASWLRHVSMR